MLIDLKNIILNEVRRGTDPKHKVQKSPKALPAVAQEAKE